jgi:hypothetical protein
MKIRHDRYGFRPIDQARTAQQRGEIVHFAAMIAISSSVSQNAISSRIDVQWPTMRSDLVCDS